MVIDISESPDYVVSDGNITFSMNYHPLKLEVVHSSSPAIPVFFDDSPINPCAPSV